MAIHVATLYENMLSITNSATMNIANATSRPTMKIPHKKDNHPFAS